MYSSFSNKDSLKWTGKIFPIMFIWNRPDLSHLQIFSTFESLMEKWGKMSQRKIEGQVIVAIFCTLITSVPFNLFMIIVGALNYSECHYSQAALFLIFVGSASICVNLIRLINQEVVVRFILWAFVNLINLIWGSVTVFGKKLNSSFI